MKKYLLLLTCFCICLAGSTVSASALSDDARSVNNAKEFMSALNDLDIHTIILKQDIEIDYETDNPKKDNQYPKISTDQTAFAIIKRNLVIDGGNHTLTMTNAQTALNGKDFAFFRITGSSTIKNIKIDVPGTPNTKLAVNSIRFFSFDKAVDNVVNIINMEMNCATLSNGFMMLLNRRGKLTIEDSNIGADSGSFTVSGNEYTEINVKNSTLFGIETVYFVHRVNAKFEDTKFYGVNRMLRPNAADINTNLKSMVNIANHAGGSQVEFKNCEFYAHEAGDGQYPEKEFLLIDRTNFTEGKHTTVLFEDVRFYHASGKDGVYQELLSKKDVLKLMEFKQHSIVNWKTGDFTRISAFFKKVKQDYLDEAQYTYDTYNPLKDSLQILKQILERELANETTVENALSVAEDALSKLVRAADYSQADSLLARYHEMMLREDQYTKDSVEPLKQAVALLNNTMANNDPRSLKLDDFDPLLQAVRDALDGLQPIADISEAQALIRQFESLQGQYTPKTHQELKEAIGVLQRLVQAVRDVTQKEIDEQVAVVKLRFASLEPLVEREDSATTKESNIHFLIRQVQREDENKLLHQIQTHYQGSKQVGKHIIMSIVAMIGEKEMELLEGESIEINMPIPKELDITRPIVVFHIDENGNLDLLESRIEAGELIIVATSFSDFVFANLVESEAIPILDNKVKATTPKSVATQNKNMKVKATTPKSAATQNKNLAVAGAPRNKLGLYLLVLGVAFAFMARRKNEL